jgi:magnesium transporter
VDSILSSIAILNERIHASQRVLDLELDAQRNKLLKTDIVLSTTTLALAFGAAVASLFGMNIRSGVEDDEGLFWGIVVGAFLFTGLLTVSALVCMKRLQIF